MGFQNPNMNNRSKLYEINQMQFRKLKKLFVIGDIHGDEASVRSLLSIFKPEEDSVIFLGDYADRGPNGVEVIYIVKSLIDRYPQNVIALKGNHEDYSNDGVPFFLPCDLTKEAQVKRGGWLKYFSYELRPFLQKLYIAAILPGEYLFLHGGISSKIRDIESLRKASEQVETDIIWSDPYEGLGEYANSRGAGVTFGEDITKEVCRRLGVKKIIRGHEPNKSILVPFYEHSDKVVTVSSTRFYGGKPFTLVIDPTRPTELTYNFL